MRRSSVLLISAAIVALLVLWGLSQPLDRTDPRIQQALIAGTFLASGWLLTFLLREFSAYLQEVEKSEDLQETLRAEIWDYSIALDDDMERAIAEVHAAVEGGERDGVPYYPFLPRVSAPVIFDALVSDIYLLPAHVLDHVVQFYAMLSDVRLMVEDLQTPEFRKLSAERRLQAYDDYLAIRQTCCELAQDAVEVLNASLAEGQGAMLLNPPTISEEDRKRKEALKQELSSHTAARGGH